MANSANEIVMNYYPPVPMDRRKLVEAQVYAAEQGKLNPMRDGIKVLVCGASTDRLREMTRFLSAFDFPTISARTPERALEAARENHAQIAIWLETESTARRGVILEAAAALREISPIAESILIGPSNSPGYAAAAFRAGVYNCMSWPVDYANLARDLNFLGLEAHRRYEQWMWSCAKREVSFEGFTGGSLRMMALYDSLRNLAQGNEPVLITGPVGSGKELAATALHSLMAKSGAQANYQPLMIFRCCGLTEERADELFARVGILGHNSGRKLQATVENSDGHCNEDRRVHPLDLLGFSRPGMVLLDEISDLPRDAQQKLASWMVVRRAVHRNYPVRIVASTRHDLTQLVGRGNFHPGLYRLLSSATLSVPALRDRAEDIPMLVDNFLDRFVQDQSGVDQLAKAPELSRDAQRALLRHSWPGNVRELRNAIRRAALLVGSQRIEADDLGLAPPPKPARGILDWYGGQEMTRSHWLQ